jgi:hypothetical protein
MTCGSMNSGTISNKRDGIGGAAEIGLDRDRQEVAELAEVDILLAHEF